MLYKKEELNPVCGIVAESVKDFVGEEVRSLIKGRNVRSVLYGHWVLPSHRPIRDEVGAVTINIVRLVKEEMKQ